MIKADPPPLVEYPDDEELEDLLPQEGCFCGRSYSQITQATISFAVFSTVIGFLASNVFHSRTNLISRSIIEVLGGASAGWFLPSILPDNYGNAYKSGISDYATPIFLIISNVFRNLSQDTQSLTHPYFAGFFNVQGGMALAAYIHSVVSWRLGTGVDHPLDSHRLDDEEPPRLKMAVDTSGKRLAVAGVITGLGVVAIFTGVLVSEAKLIRDFGIILTGSGAARIFSELWWIYANPKFAKEQEGLLQVQDPRYSCGIRNYSLINRIILVAFHALPGALIVTAELAAEKNIASLSMTIFAITGIVIGWNEHLRQARFSEVAKDDLHEVRVNHERIFPPKNLCGWGNWFVGVPCVLTFFGLILAGYNPESNSFQKVDPYVISSISTLAVTLYASYFFSEGARLAFKKEPKSRSINTAYNFTHFSLGVPLVFLYVMEKLLINDEALDLDGPYAGVLTTLAWGSLGWALGTEASSRDDHPNPRVVSSLYLALFGRYFINLVSGNA